MTTPPQFPSEQPPTVPGPLAEWGDRVVATLIDGAIIVAGYIALFIVVLVLGAISDALAALVGVLGYLALVFVGLYFGYMEGQAGQSPGKKLTGLKVVKLDGGLLGGSTGVVRKLVHFVDGIFLIGYLLPLFDPQKQTFADKIMGTVVLKSQAKQAFSLEILKA